jgi:hypothetical protein
MPHPKTTLAARIPVCHANIPYAIHIPAQPCPPLPFPPALTRMPTLKPTYAYTHRMIERARQLYFPECAAVRALPPYMMPDFLDTQNLPPLLQPLFSFFKQTFPQLPSISLEHHDNVTNTYVNYSQLRHPSVPTPAVVVDVDARFRLVRTPSHLPVYSYLRKHMRTHFPIHRHIHTYIHTYAYIFFAGARQNVGAFAFRVIPCLLILACAPLNALSWLRSLASVFLAFLPSCWHLARSDIHTN